MLTKPLSSKTTQFKQWSTDQEGSTKDMTGSSRAL